MDSSASYVSHLAILGSTGSIGTQALDVIRKNVGRHVVLTLAAREANDTLIAQIKEFCPKFVSVKDEATAASLRRTLLAAGVRPPEIAFGEEGIIQAATFDGVQTAIVAVTGFAALPPVCAAIRRGVHLALANKESLVAGGDLIREALNQSSSVIVPVDSEHSSIFQCLNRRGLAVKPKQITITASGGPFLNTPLNHFSKITAREAIRHPRWNMGAKISVDSATLMNKGLEVIEAAELFALSADEISVLIHPQSIVHGLVEYQEGTTIAALYQPDMRVPIAFALSYLSVPTPAVTPGTAPLESGTIGLNLLNGPLTFSKPDPERFPALSLCYHALRLGRAHCVTLNAVNEVAVAEFLRERIGFNDIIKVLEKVLESRAVSQLRPENLRSFSQVMELDAEARIWANGAICEIGV